jgi:hypothetical protein
LGRKALEHAACGLGDDRFFLGRVTGRADHMHDAGCRAQFGEHKRRRRYGEFDQPIGRLEQRRGIADHLDTVRPETREFARIAADHGRAGGLDGAGECHAFGHGDSVHKRAPHAPASARDHQPYIGISRHGAFSPPAAGIADFPLPERGRTIMGRTL